MYKLNLNPFAAIVIVMLVSIEAIQFIPGLTDWLLDNGEAKAGYLSAVATFAAVAAAFWIPAAQGRKLTRLALVDTAARVVSLGPIIESNRAAIKMLNTEPGPRTRARIEHLLSLPYLTSFTANRSFIRDLPDDVAVEVLALMHTCENYVYLLRSMIIEASQFLGGSGSFIRVDDQGIEFMEALTEAILTRIQWIEESVS